MLNFVSLHDNRCLKSPSAICFGEGRDEQMLNVSHEIFRTFMMKLSLFFYVQNGHLGFVYIVGA